MFSPIFIFFIFWINIHYTTLCTTFIYNVQKYLYIFVFNEYTRRLFNQIQKQLILIGAQFIYNDFSVAYVVHYMYFMQKRILETDTRRKNDVRTHVLLNMHGKHLLFIRHGCFVTSCNKINEIAETFITELPLTLNFFNGTNGLIARSKLRF